MSEPDVDTLLFEWLGRWCISRMRKALVFHQAALIMQLTQEADGSPGIFTQT